jgi:hypothetical protein
MEATSTVSHKQAVVDIDDLCDMHDPYDTLCFIKEQVPEFKATVFAIPNRCSEDTLRRYLDTEWLRLGMHGWNHTMGECLSWGPDEAEDKILLAAARGMDEAFRAPKWIISPVVYEVCHSLDIPVADHSESYCLVDPMPLIYRNTPDNPTHFHTWDTCGNGITKSVAKRLARYKTFKFVGEVAE